MNEGYYLCEVQAGIYNITAEAEGYQTFIYPDVYIGEADILTKHFGMIPLDRDSDEDGVPDGDDNCPSISNEDQVNTDNDAAGNACDSDDDNDGMPDAWEVQYGFNALLNDASVDSDSDGYSNLEEYRGHSDPLDSNSYPRSSTMPCIPLLLLDEY
jgi:hypothetical protein